MGIADEKPQQVRPEKSIKMNKLKHYLVAAFALTFLCISLSAAANAQAAANRSLMGSLTAISGDQITVKTAQGDEHSVQVPSSAQVKSIEPGQTNLSTAVDMPYSQLAVGDRVLVSLDPNSTGATPQALRVVAIKASDLAKKQQQEAADWQQNGVGGLVKSVDATAGTIVVTSGAGVAAKTVVIHTDKSTILKRYAPTSVNYDSATVAPFSTIQAGDQLMARGSKNADGAELAAKEVVSGSFRNLSGLVASIDPTQQTFTIKDLASKKQYTVQITAQSQMRQVPDRLAQMLAARLKGTPAASGSGAPQGGSAAGSPPQGGNGGGQGGAGFQRGGQGGAGGQGGGGNDPQQMLSRAPAIHFTDLQKGEAVMLVASPGDSQVTAITLLAGVEALLQAPSSQNLLANWSMGGGGEGGDAGAQ
jgi:hypothetical protein